MPRLRKLKSVDKDDANVSFLRKNYQDALSAFIPMSHNRNAYSRVNGNATSMLVGEIAADF